jgi:hypothetical protein
LLAKELSFQVVLGVCSHEHVSVLSVLCSALPYSAGSFTRLFQDVSHEPISSLSVFCTSALLQRWFFHQADLAGCLLS